MFSKIALIGAVLAVVVVVGNVAYADSLYGTCVYEDGSKGGWEVGISTSWNSKRTSPHLGRYTLDFGETVKNTITVYCNGTTVGRVYVSGSTRFDIVVP